MIKYTVEWIIIPLMSQDIHSLALFKKKNYKSDNRTYKSKLNMMRFVHRLILQKHEFFMYFLS